jgi:hypothetical protein
MSERVIARKEFHERSSSIPTQPKGEQEEK